MDADKEPPRPGYWRARVFGEPCFVKVGVEKLSDDSWIASADCRLAGYGFVDELDKAWRWVELLEWADPAGPVGEGSARAAETPEPAEAIAAPVAGAIVAAAPHPSHRWEEMADKNGTMVCRGCGAFSTEPAAALPCRDAAARAVADAGAPVALRAEMPREAAPVADEAAALAKVRDPAKGVPQGVHTWGAVGPRLGCLKCGQPMTQDVEARPCPL
jgi:hypothetical protein